MRRTSLPLALAFVLAGCGGSNHHDATATDATVEGGSTNLSTAFTADDPTKSLTSAQKAFDGAYARTPNDPRTAMGYGVSTVALDVQSLTGLLGARAQAQKGLAGLRNVTALNGLGERLRTSTRASLATAIPALGFGVRSRAEGPSLGDLKAIANDLRKVVSRLTNDRIEALEATPLVLTIGDGGVGVKLGTVEGYAIRAAAEAAISGLDGALAYDLVPADVSTDVFETKFASAIAAGTAITPSSYLPGDAFGTLQTGGAALLTELGDDLGAAAADGNLALTRLGTRPTGNGFLTDLEPITSDEQATLKTQFDLAASIASGPTSVPVSTSAGSLTFTVNLPAVIATPPASLRVFYPSVKATTASDGTVTLSLVSGTVADATLGGFVPAGVPDAVLYGRTLAIDDTTTQGEVADWASPLGFLAGS